jgi:hypothetical protein
MAWVLRNNKTHKYVTMAHIFGLAGAETYTSNPIAAAKFARPADARKALKGESKLRNVSVKQLGRETNPLRTRKGKVPPHLRRYLFKKGHR